MTDNLTPIESVGIGAGAIIAANIYGDHKRKQELARLWATVEQETVNRLGPAAYTPQGQYVMNQVFQEHAAPLIVRQQKERRSNVRFVTWFMVIAALVLVWMCFF